MKLELEGASVFPVAGMLGLNFPFCLWRVQEGIPRDLQGLTFSLSTLATVSRATKCE